MSLAEEYAYAAERAQELTAAALLAEVQGAPDAWKLRTWALHYQTSAVRLRQQWEAEVSEEIYLLTHDQQGRVRCASTGHA